MLQVVHDVHFPLHVALVVPARRGHELDGQLKARGGVGAPVDDAELTPVGQARR